MERLAWVAVFPCIIAVIWQFSRPRSASLEIEGTVAPGFEEVRRLFTEASQEERGGTALALLVKGELVADLYGGYSDPESGDLWTSSTKAVSFSITKVFAGLAFAHLKETAGFNYDDKVSKHWPEFSAHGKENITIVELLDHQSGLLTFARDFTMEESRDQELISNLIEEAKPLFVPGSGTGYSGVAYGFVLDQLLRRLDPKKRTVSQYFAEEFKPYSSDQDFTIGIPESESHQVAKISNPTILQSAIAYMKRPLRYIEILTTFFKNGMIAEHSASFPKFLDLMPPNNVPFNRKEIQAVGLVSCGGIGTARALATTIRAAANRLSSASQDLLAEPRGEAFDKVLATNRFYGHGLFYERHPFDSSRYITVIIGNGLQYMAWDPKDDRILIVLRNGLHAGPDGLDEVVAIRDAAFRATKA